MSNPFQPTKQNDYREVTITPEAEREHWHDSGDEEVLGAKFEPVRELNADEWQPITRTISTEPALFLGEDPQRRSAVIYNASDVDVYLAPRREALPVVATSGVVVTSGILPGRGQLTITHTREIYAVASNAAGATLSAFIERGERRR